MLLLAIIAAALGQADLPTPADPQPLDLASVRALLATAPLERQGQGVVLGLPMPDGSWNAFEVFESPIMEPELAARFPEIRTYIAQGLDDPSQAARLDLSSLGLHAIVRGGSGSVLISSVPGNLGLVASRRWGEGSAFWECGVGPDTNPPPTIDYRERGPTPLRTYRTAVSCSGELSVFAASLVGHAPNVTDSLAAVVAMTNRADLLLEGDLAVRLVLVANNDQLVFLDPATDPFDGVDSNANLSANINTCNARIGAANFDVGHVLTRIPGGVAYLRAVCGSVKAGGVSGVPRTDTGDPLDPQVMMHELGHQFGANHSFNGNVDRCLSNRNSSTAWEPGSGTTIMSYAGGCPVGNSPPGDNLAISRDVMYHVGNLLEMQAFLAAGGAGCGTSTPTGNTPPTLGTLPPLTGLTIPRLTPFELASSATDTNGDSVTYSWEEFDLGPQQSLTGPDNADNGLSPIFRTFAPTPSGTRLFPKVGDVLSGVPTLGEKMPSSAPATRRFRLVARDNRAGGGGVTISPVIAVNVAGTGPFEVLSPHAGDQMSPLSTVQWSVAGTNAAPINCATVSIALSRDDGLTFTEVLAANAPNIGTTSVRFTGATTNARLRISADNGIFVAYSQRFEIYECIWDLNRDGNEDQDDISYLIHVIGGGTNSENINPDVNHDGNVDQDDVAYLVNAISGSGPMSGC